MAKVKFSGVGIVDMRGKLNGSVMSKNRAGAYVRTKVTPVNPNTIAQQLARTLLTGFSQSWRGLTQNQRDAWNAAVQDFQKTDIFGDLKAPTGKNLYTLLNVNLSNTGNATISVPPQPSAVNAILAGTVTISVGAPTYEVAYTGAGASVDILVFATAPQSPGKNFVKSEYRLIGTFAGSAASPYDFEADYLAKFGSPAVGSKVFIGLQSVNATTGQAGVMSSSSAIVAA